MVGLMFGGYFRFKINDRGYENNDRLIFSKGHAAPLLYTLWHLATSNMVNTEVEVTEEELLALRKFESGLEGHPTMRFPYTEAATGSLGQGLSVGLGMALNAKMEGLDYRTWVLMGDSEMSEGSVWEAVELAAFYKLENLVGVVDVNRLGQRGETMWGHDLEAFRKRVEAFEWEVLVVEDGHSLEHIVEAYGRVARVKRDKPVMVVAKTVKGRGVTFLEDQEGWHGKALNKEELERALGELGEVDILLRGELEKPEQVAGEVRRKRAVSSEGSFDFAESAGVKPSTKLGEGYKLGDKVATRKAYGSALVKVGTENSNVVVLDAETSNSTYAGEFGRYFPKRFFEMYLGEQNMVGSAVGLAQRGKVPFVSSFSAFLTRAFDQARMAQYSEANIKVCGSHGGVSIGEDGPSQMGLEDLAMMRSISGSVVLYPADAVAAEKLVGEMVKHEGIVYLRTTRMAVPVVYEVGEEFVIGGSKVLKESSEDQVAVVGAGVTVHEALKAHEMLSEKGVKIRVIDLFSIKPVDVETLKKAASETKAVVTVEDHFAEGGLGEAVNSALSEVSTPIYNLAVRKMPRSGKPEELMDYEEISAKAIVERVLQVVGSE
jgi:transketolase